MTRSTRSRYLEFFDTYFMVLRGKMEQVRSMNREMRDGAQRGSHELSLTEFTTDFVRFHSFIYITTQRLRGHGGSL